MTEQPNANAPAPDLTEPSFDEQSLVRREKRERLLAEGKAAYAIGIGRTHTLAEVREAYEDKLESGEETQDVVTVAGRVMFVRNTGKLAFATLQEGIGTRLQVMLSLAEVGEEALAEWKALVDLGDHVAVTGRVISSRRGELSVMASSWQMAGKALRPLPVLHKDLSEEARVRQRYADLIVRQEARDMVRTRAAITQAVRRRLEDDGYLEVETPVLQLIHGGAHARPFNTHMNAFDQQMSLRIALELNLKKAVVGGVDKVYEIGRIFRNEGVDSTHSPEFTMVEAYQAYGDQFTIAEMLKGLFLAAADAVGSRQIEVSTSSAPGDDSTSGEGSTTGATQVIDLDGEWKWLPVYQGVSEAVGVEVTPDTDLETLRALADKHDVELDPAWGAGKVVMELCGELVEPHLIQPTFLCDFPAIAQPLARLNDDEPRQVLAWDLIIGGVERGTGFTELIDPVVQREILTAQSLMAAGGDPEAMQLDEDFLRALEYGAPPMGGMGFGLDRMIMLFTGAGIRETILFPLLKPEA